MAEFSPALSNATAPYVPKAWADDGTFHLGINMAGAVSAGAYTAGALDFLMEAIEQWYAAKDANDPMVPRHKLSIDVFSGASAGGMCAAIAAVMVQGPFDHIRNAEEKRHTGTTNTFYESWVNWIDIVPLLGQDDLQKEDALVSLLDCTIIDTIADKAIVPRLFHTPAYISHSLTLFLALTNVRGTPYSLEGNATGSAEQQIAYYADRIQFETVAQGARPLSPFAKPLPLGVPGPEWELLKKAAKATGAFPAFLAPRVIERPMEDYLYMPWLSADHTAPTALPPQWNLEPGDIVKTLNVDGGMTNNDPFQLAHDYLAIHNKSAKQNCKTGRLENPQPPEEANCAVLTIAPFPANDLYDSNFKPEANRGVFSILQRLFTTLLSQSRFLGESIVCLLSPSSFSRFVLVPSDDTRKDKRALQCASFSAFGGFFDRSFRAHDYQLGRRNCQRFLSEHFLLAEDNPIIASGLAGMSAETRAAADKKFLRTAMINGKQTRMYCIVPLCGSASKEAEVPLPPLGKIKQSRLDDIVSLIEDRLSAIIGPLVDDLPISHPKKLLVKAVLHTLRLLSVGKIKDYLQKELKHDIVS